MIAGCNDAGDVANFVETEQIVHNASTLNHARPVRHYNSSLPTDARRSGQFTSYVQLRGSVPAFWSQDHLGFKAKPPIRIDRSDPFATQAAIHFDQVPGCGTAPAAHVDRSSSTSTARPW